MFWMRLIIGTVLWIAVQPVFAEEKILWLKFDYPPAYIVNGAEKDKGFADAVFLYFAKNLPEYTHISKEVPTLRLQYEFDHNQDITCVANQPGKPDRFGPEVISTSEPAYFMPPGGIVIRKEDMALFNNGNAVSLKELLKNAKLKCGFLKGARLGRNIPILIQENEKNVLYVPYTEPVKMFQLLLAKPKRIDYCPMYPFAFSYYINKLDDQEKAEVMFVPIVEENEPISTRPFCHNTDAGKKVLEKLEKLQKTSEFRKMVIEDRLLNYLPDSLREEYRKINGLTSQ